MTPASSTYSDCNTFRAGNCTDCVSGEVTILLKYAAEVGIWYQLVVFQVSCNPIAFDYSLSLVAIAGFDSTGEISSTEAHSLSGDAASTCSQPPPFPNPVKYITGALSGGHPVVCGGFDGTVYHKECQVFRPESGVWTVLAELEVSRSLYGIVQLNQNDFWITGLLPVIQVCLLVRVYALLTPPWIDFLRWLREWLPVLHVWDLRQRFRCVHPGPGVTLHNRQPLHDQDQPDALRSHRGRRIRKLSEWVVFLYEVVNKTKPSILIVTFFFFLLQDQILLYDFSTGEWTSLPPMQRERVFHGCGFVNGELVVAVGSHENSTEIFSFETR